MKFIKIPKFIVPPNLDQIVANQKPRPLSYCKDCGYVKCSCGNCHSEECLEACSYESDEDGVSTPDADGKVWCTECGGSFLPHEH